MLSMPLIAEKKSLKILCFLNKFYLDDFTHMITKEVIINFESLYLPEVNKVPPCESLEQTTLMDW